MAVDGIGEYLKSVEDDGFGWGTADCWTLVSGWLRALGHGAVCDSIDKRLGKYSTEVEFVRRARRAGLEITPTNVKFNLPVVANAALPEPGDVAVWRCDGRNWGLGLVDDEGLFVGRSSSGLLRFAPQGNFAVFHVKQQ